MGRVFVTGDKHGDFVSDKGYVTVRQFCQNNDTTTDDVMIVLGDHGVHYDGGWGDHHAKKNLSKYPITFVMIRGNHDQRCGESWQRKLITDSRMDGWFVKDPEFDNILYTEEFGWYVFGGNRVFVINGAYSADKWYRLSAAQQGDHRYKWFSNEQLDVSERERAERVFFDKEQYLKEPFYIMSHTCPRIYKPWDALHPAIDQNTVDETMEFWMDLILGQIESHEYPLKQWFCGHWHIDRVDGVMRFMFKDILSFGLAKEAKEDPNDENQEA